MLCRLHSHALFQLVLVLIQIEIRIHGLHVGIVHYNSAPFHGSTVQILSVGFKHALQIHGFIMGRLFLLLLGLQCEIRLGILTSVMVSFTLFVRGNSLSPSSFVLFLRSSISLHSGDDSFISCSSSGSLISSLFLISTPNTHF